MKKPLLYIAAAVLMVLPVAGQLNFWQAAAKRSWAPPDLGIANVSAHWDMDETSGTRQDSGAYNADLGQSGTVSSTTGKIGNAASFTANTANFLTVADNDRFSASAGHSLTVTAWLRMNTTNTYRWAMAKRGTSNGTREWEIVWSHPNFAFGVFTNAATAVSAYAPSPFATATWYFVVAEIDNTNNTARIRVGNSSTLGVWSTAASFPVFGPSGSLGTNTTAEVYVGKSQDGGGWDGAIDNVTIRRYLLTDQQITNLWNEGAGKQYPFD